MSAQVFESMPAKEYHARPEWSRSQLETLIKRGPRVFRDKYITRDLIEPPTDAMVIGTLVHALLEGGNVQDVIAVEPTGLKSRNSKAWDAFASAGIAEGKEPVTAGMFAEAVTAALELKSNPGYLDYSQHMHRESSVVWRHESGLDLRCRFDAYSFNRVLDVKTTSGSVEVGDVVSAIEKWGYYRQAAFYSLGYHAAYGAWPEFTFAFVQVEYPYESTLFTMPESWVNRGLAEVTEWLADLAARLATGNWERATYGQRVTGEEPRWAKYKNEYSL